MPEDRSSDQSPAAAPPAGQVAPALDDTDRAIVAELRRDGRLSVRLPRLRPGTHRLTATIRPTGLHRAGTSEVRKVRVVRPR